jgi:hypothetical protein
MTEPTPSQAEGERDDEPEQSERPEVPRSVPSQAEGERDEAPEDESDERTGGEDTGGAG